MFLKHQSLKFLFERKERDFKKAIEDKFIIRWLFVMQRSKNDEEFS